MESVFCFIAAERLVWRKKIKKPTQHSAAAAPGLIYIFSLLIFPQAPMPDSKSATASAQGEKDGRRKTEPTHRHKPWVALIFLIRLN